jgi:hypothetical protein
VRDRSHRNFGFKRHYIAASPTRDSIDLYSFSRGYLGVNAVEGGITNICGLAHASRLTGQEPRSVEDNETTFEQLHARIASSIAHLETFTPEQFEGSEQREVSFKSRAGELKFDGKTYLLAYVLPNVYFHVTTAYALVRQAGAPIGKNDFLGKE